MQVVPLILLLTTLCAGQVNVDRNPDPNWPKYQVTQVDFIPKGTTVNNTENYFLDGSYTVITNLLGDKQLEFSLKLH